MALAVKVPKNQQSRLALDIWMVGEAITRHRGMSSNREAFEYAIRLAADKLAVEDASFRQVWQEVRREGIEADD